MTPSQAAQGSASDPGGSSTGGVATAMPGAPPKAPKAPFTSSMVERSPPSMGALPSLASLMNSVDGAGSSGLQRVSIGPGPGVSRFSAPTRSSFASPPAEASSTGRHSRYEPLYPYTSANRPSSSHTQTFYSVIDTPRNEDGGKVPPPQNSSWHRPSFDGSVSPFWAAAIGQSSSSSTSTAQSFEPRESQQEQIVDSNGLQASTTATRKRAASPSPSPPSTSDTTQPKHRRTQPARTPTINAPSEAWVRPAPPRIRNSTQWGVERVQGYKDGYSDAMDAVKRGQLGWEGSTYSNFVFWRHSPALVAAETQSEDGDNGDTSPFGEDRSPVTDGDDQWSPELLPVASKHRRPPMGARNGTQTSHGSQNPQYGQNVEQNRRQAISCWPCRKRKLKCDGQHPCGTCVRRPAAQGCVYEQEIKRRGKGRKSHNDGVNPTDEIDQLEQ